MSSTGDRVPAASASNAASSKVRLPGSSTPWRGGGEMRELCDAPSADGGESRVAQLVELLAELTTDALFGERRCATRELDVWLTTDV